MRRVYFLLLALFSSAMIAADESRPGCVTTGFAKE